MSVTIVARQRARPGAGDALARALARLLEAPAPGAGPRQSARLFQSRDDPDSLLYVGTWDDRAAHAAYVRALRPRPADALRAGEIEHQRYDQLALYEDMSRRATAVVCMTVGTPPATAAALRAFVARQARCELLGRPGLVLRGVYQDQDTPERLFIVHGWETDSALEAFVAEMASTLQARLAGWGAQAELFIGRVRAEVDRYSALGGG